MGEEESEEDGRLRPSGSLELSVWTNHGPAMARLLCIQNWETDTEDSELASVACAVILSLISRVAR